jgi:hypothetical protein
MKASKPLASVVAAAAVVGAIGLAYAQTPGSSTGATSSGDTSSQTMQNQGTTGTHYRHDGQHERQHHRQQPVHDNQRHCGLPVRASCPG